jgi:hypothetical protein
MRSEEEAYMFNLFTNGHKNRDFHEFLSEYARLKNLSVNFDYRTQGKSAVEQSHPSVRAGLGVFTYLKGNLQQLKTTGVEPIAEGIESGNYKKVFTGLNSLSKNLTLKTISNIIPMALGLGTAGGVIFGDDDEEDQLRTFVTNSFLSNFGGLGAPIVSVAERMWGALSAVGGSLINGKAPSPAQRVKLVKAFGPSVPALPQIARGMELYYGKMGVRPGSEWAMFSDWFDANATSFERMSDEEYEKIFADNETGLLGSGWYWLTGKKAEVPELPSSISEAISAVSQAYLRTAIGYKLEPIDGTGRSTPPR